MDVVAVTPLITVVTMPFEAVSDDPVMIDDVEVIPLSDEVRVFTADERALLLINVAVVVDVLPLTIEVSMKELVDVETESTFDVDDAMRLLRSVDVATPFMVVVRIVPDVESALEEMTEDVAVTPLMVVVSVLPESDCVNELMIEAREEERPLMTVWKKLPDEDATFVVMIVEVAIDPPRFEVMVLLDEERVFEVERLVTERLVTVAFSAVSAEIVAVANVEFPNATNLPVVVAFPEPSTVKAELADHAAPFQKSVWFATVPSASVPVADASVTQ
jgi:hypothetical protein